MSRQRTAAIARQLGWTMAEVRAHALGDLVAMLELVGDERRVREMRAAGRVG